MTSLEDLLNQTALPVFTGTQKASRPSKSMPADTPKPAPDDDSVSQAGDPDDPYTDQAKAREQARQDSPLPPVKNRNMLQVNVSGRMKQLIEGEITVDDLDDEELMSGNFRDASGNLTGNRSKLIPKSVHQEVMRRILQRGQERIRSDYFNALDVVSDIMSDDQNDPAVRLRAANMIIERTAGKTPEKVELSLEVKKYEQIATSIIREIPEDIEEAELVEDDDLD